MSHGASMRSWRRAARKVMVFQWPCGTLALSLVPEGDQPRRGAMLVLVQVSSRKTRVRASIRPDTQPIAGAFAPRPGDPARQPPEFFFEGQVLGMHELPNRPDIHLEPALSQLANQPFQREVPCPHAFHQP